MPRRIVVAALGLVALLVPAGLVFRAAANEWRAPSLLPQRFGTRGLDAVWGDPALRSAVTTSIVVATTVAIAALLLAWPAARVIAGSARPAPLVVVLVLPLLVPGYAVGTGIAAWLIRLGVPGGPIGIGIAHIPFVLAYETLVLLPAFDAHVEGLEETAAVLGARRFDRVRLVVLPSVSAATASALLVGFTVSLTQYGSTLAVGAGTSTLPVLLVPFAQSDPQIAATLALLMLLPALLVVALARARRPRATSFR